MPSQSFYCHKWIIFPLHGHLEKEFIPQSSCRSYCISVSRIKSFCYANLLVVKSISSPHTLVSVVITQQDTLVYKACTVHSEINFHFVWHKIFYQPQTVLFPFNCGNQLATLGSLNAISLYYLITTVLLITTTESQAGAISFQLFCNPGNHTLLG